MKLLLRALTLLLLSLIPLRAPAISGGGTLPPPCDCIEPAGLRISEPWASMSSYWIGEEVGVHYYWSKEGCKPYSRPAWSGLGSCGAFETDWWTPELWGARVQEKRALSLTPTVEMEYSVGCGGTTLNDHCGPFSPND